MVNSSILVLEDDENLRELAVDVLNSLDYQADGAENADEAIRKDRERRKLGKSGFWLIISDVRMAGARDGVGALELLKQERPELRCIVVTGFADQTVPTRALKIHVDDYLYKPFELTELVAAIERVKTQHQSKSLFQRVKDLLTRKEDDQNYKKAQTFRESCLHYYWVAIRSKALYHETALAIWDQIEQVELRFMECLDDPQSVSLNQWRTLTASYSAWQSKIDELARTESFIMSQARAPGLVPKATFRIFFDKIQAGKVISQDLIQAAYARTLPRERLQEDPNSAELYTKFWGPLP